MSSAHRGDVPAKAAILQIVPSLDAGGAERATIDMARALTAAGYVALVVSEGGRLENELSEAGGELIRLPVASKNPLTLVANAGRLADIIRKRTVRLLHARSRAPAWSALIAARRTGIPFVTTYHGIYTSREPLKHFYNSIMVKSDATIANSQWTAAHIRATYGARAKRLVVIPRGLDFSVFDPAKVARERIAALMRQWGVHADERVVLLPGRLTRWKGQLVFVKALALLKDRDRLPAEVRAVIAGDAQGRAEYVAELAAAIDSAHLRGVVIVSEHITDMPAAYLVSDIVVSASTDPEAFGRVAPEAAAMARAVIATDHGGARETVLAGQSGRLTRPGDAAALADALADLLVLPAAELAAMGARGRAHVIERYTVERMCADTLALYRELMR